MARPSLYEQKWKHNLDKVEAWARRGLNNLQIAHNMGISDCTLYEWQNKYPEFAEVLKRGKEVIDEEVENALLQRALGYDVEEITKKLRTNPETGERELVVVEKKTKHYAPDTTAQIFWLKNRKPEKWRDKKDLEVSTPKLEDFVGEE